MMIKNRKNIIGLLIGALIVTTIVYGGKVQVISQKHKRKLFKMMNAGFKKKKKYENPYWAIRKYLRRNNLKLSAEDLEELENLYWSSLGSINFLKDASKILKQPVIYFFEGDFLFLNNGERRMSMMTQVEDVMPLLDEYPNAIIVFQEVSNAFYIVTPPNEQ